MGIKIPWILIVAAFLTSTSGLNQYRIRRSVDLEASQAFVSDIKLPAKITPTAYQIDLKPILENGTFEGTIRMNLTCNEDSKKIFLHADNDLIIDQHDIKLKEINLEEESEENEMNKSEEVKVQSVDRIRDRNVVVIYLKKMLKEGTQCELEITFSGLIGETSEGLFKGNYSETNGERKYYLATYMRAHNARRVFPCFDEPEYKVPYTVSILRPKEYTTLFNTPIKNTEQLKSNYVIDHFERTPPMSSFTFGFVISQLPEVSTNSTDGTDPLVIRMWARSGIDNSKNLEKVYKKAVAIYKYFKQYFGAQLPLSKIDLIAVPGLSTYNPIDNWGLIFFNESQFLSTGHYAVTRELVYQWLGSWVSPRWWSDEPLNKALAISLVSPVIYELESEYYEKYPGTLIYTLYYGLSDVKPLNMPQEMDGLSAYKTDLLLRMLNYTLGGETFKKGLRKLVAQRQFSTFTNDDVWDALTKEAHTDKILCKNITVNEIAVSWITSHRLPIVTFERNYEEKTVIISQKVYLRQRPNDVSEQYSNFWWIPLVIVTEDKLDFTNSTPHIWMSKTREINLSNMPEQDKFIIVNPEEIGPFPVNYDKKNWNLLAQYLQTEDGRAKIPNFTRAKLIHDAWNLAYAGHLHFATALNMTLFMKSERNHMVWHPFLTFIDHVGRRIDMSSAYDKFTAYIRDLLVPFYEDLGPPVEGEENWKTDLRSTIHSYLCQIGYGPCIAEAQTAFKKWMENENPDEGNPVSEKYICPVFKWGNPEEWEFGLERVINFPSSGAPRDRSYLLNSLAGCSRQPEKIERLLNITVLEENGNFTETNIRHIFSALTGGSIGYNTLFTFLSENWDAVEQRFQNKTNLWNDLINCATCSFATQEGYDLVFKLYKQRHGQFGSAEHIIEKALKTITIEAKWSDENFPVIERWLDNYFQQ